MWGSEHDGLSVGRVEHASLRNPVESSVARLIRLSGIALGCVAERSYSVQLAGDVSSNWRPSGPPSFTIGVPRPVPRSDWGCAVVLESAKTQLAWLGEKGDLGMPQFLPELPKAQRDCFEAKVEREGSKFWRGVEGAHKAKRSKARIAGNGRRPTRPDDAHSIRARARHPACVVKPRARMQPHD